MTVIEFCQACDQQTLARIVCCSHMHSVVVAVAVTSSANTPESTSPSKDDTEAIKYKAAAVAAVKEYLSSSDMQEVSSNLGELQQPHLAHIFVKQVSFALSTAVAAAAAALAAALAAVIVAGAFAASIAASIAVSAALAAVSVIVADAVGTAALAANASVSAAALATPPAAALATPPAAVLADIPVPAAEAAANNNSSISSKGRSSCFLF